MDPNRYATMMAVLISPAVVGILSEQLKLDETVALEKYMSSSLYAALSDEEQKLWHCSPELLASLVEEELLTGKFEYPQEAL